MSFLENLFKKKDDSHALGIDIGSSAIKIVQLKKKNGQAVLETYGELALGPYMNLAVGQAAQLPVEKIAQAVSDLMKEKEVNVTTNKCGLSIPFASSLMSVVEMPDVGPEKLKSMVPLEARKYIPVPIQEVMLDWSVIPKVDDMGEAEVESYPAAQHFGERSATPSGAEAPQIKKTNVLIVAIHNDTIARYQDIVTKAGLEAGFFEIEVFSTMRSVLDEALRPVLVMDMGAASTKLYILERGIVRTSHTVNRGAQNVTAALASSLGISVDQAEAMKRTVGLTGGDLTKPGDGKAAQEVMSLVLDYIWSETQTVLLSFEKKYNKPVSKILLVGGGASLKGILELAKSNFKMDVELGLPFNKVSAPAFLDNILKETGPEFAVSIGLALRKLSEE